MSVAASLTVLYVFYRKDIRRTYDLEDLRVPREAIEDPVTFRAGWWVLALLLVGYFAADPLGVPVSIVAGLGAVVLLVVSRRQRVIDTTHVMRGAPWQIVVFSLGRYLVVFGLNNAGLTDYLTALLDGFASYGVVAASVEMGVTVATLSAVMNNMPTVMIGALSIESWYRTQYGPIAPEGSLTYVRPATGLGLLSLLSQCPALRKQGPPAVPESTDSTLCPPCCLFSA